MYLQTACTWQLHMSPTSFDMEHPTTIQLSSYVLSRISLEVQIKYVCYLGELEHCHVKCFYV